MHTHSTFGYPPAVWARARQEALEAIRETAANQDMITYSQLAARVNAIPQLEPRSPQMDQLLAQISTEEHEAHRGLITAIVVHKNGDKEPGEGFWRCAESLGYDVQDRPALWSGMVKRVWQVHRRTGT